MRRMFALFGLALALLVGPARADTRVALIVANARYVGAELQNPPVDASLVEKSLRSVGFDVKVVADADLETFDAAISDFADRAKGADLALFYYAGHGFAVNAGLRPVSVLMATDAKLTATSELVLERGGIPVDLIVARLRGHAKATLVFIDACRNDPRLGRGAGGDGRGFAPGERFSGGGLYIGISTQLGDTALDGDAGRGSPFARAFAAAIPTKGLRIDDAFRVIRDAVEKETSGKQAPDVLKDELPNGSITLAALEPAASVMAPRPPDAVPDDGARARQEAFNGRSRKTPAPPGATFSRATPRVRWRTPRGDSSPGSRRRPSPRPRVRRSTSSPRRARTRMTRGWRRGRQRRSRISSRAIPTVG